MPTDLPHLYALQTWTLRGNFAPRRGPIGTSYYASVRRANERVLAGTRACGYTAVEVSARGNMPLGDFLKLVDEVGLACSGIHLPCLCDLGHKSVSPIVESTVAALANALPQRSDWKGFIFTFMGNPDYLRGDPGQYKTLAELMRIAQRACALRGRGAVFAYHLYDFDLEAKDDCVKAILDEGVKLVLDTFYFRRASDRREYGDDERWDRLLKQYESDIIALHLNDTSSDGAQVSLGKGVEPWPMLFSYVGHLTNCELLVVEHDAMGDAGHSMARESAAYLLAEPRLLNCFWRNRHVSKGK